MHSAKALVKLVMSKVGTSQLNIAGQKDNKIEAGARHWTADHATGSDHHARRYRGKRATSTMAPIPRPQRAQSTAKAGRRRVHEAAADDPVHA
jgi:hypothetical protein